MRTLKAICLVLLTASLLRGQTALQGKPVSESTSRSILVNADEDYRIGPNDVVEVYVLKMPELSREYRVSADGTVEIPFLGKTKTQKKTAEELAVVIADGLRGDYLKDPQVSVIVKQV